MFYSHSDSGDIGGSNRGDFPDSPGSGRIADSRYEWDLSLTGEGNDGISRLTATAPADPSLKHYSGYERELIQSVWEFAEIVPGIDPALWRRDEFGDWIYRLDYGRRSSEFGWEIFDPGVGRHAQGVYAMRPMQWQSYIRQYETLS
jgi:hypothetical protein